MSKPQLDPKSTVMREVAIERERGKQGLYKLQLENKLDAQHATVAKAAKLEAARRLEQARALLAYSPQDLATVLAASTLMSKATGKGEAEGKIEAASEAGLLPEGNNGKGKGKTKIVDVTTDVPQLPA